jgi:hypothetical protein
VSRIQYLPRPIIIHFVQLVSTRTGVPCVPSIPDHSPPCLPDKPNFPPPPIPTNFNYPDNVSNVWLENENEFGAVKVDYGNGDGVDSNYEEKRYDNSNDNYNEYGRENERGNEREMKGEYDEGEREHGEKSKAEKLKSVLKGSYVATSMTQAVRLKDSTFAVPEVNFDVYETSNLKEKIKLEQDLLRERQEKDREKEREREESEKKAELVRGKERLAKEKEEVREREREEISKREKEERKNVEKMKKADDGKTKETEKELENENEEKKLKIMRLQAQFFSTPIGDNNDNKIEEENEEKVFESLENKFDNLFETVKISSKFTDFEEEDIFSTTNAVKKNIVSENKTTKNVTQNNGNNKYDDFDEIFGNVSPNQKSGKSVKTGNVTIFDGVYEENENENEVEKEIDEFPEICLNSPDDFESEIVNEESV